MFYRTARIVRNSILFLLLSFVTLVQSAFAVGEVSITLASQEILWLDANKCSAEGPRGAWLSFEIENITAPAATLDNASIVFSSNFSTVLGPTTSQPLFVAPTDDTRTVSSLAFGETALAYFYVDYSEVCNNSQGGGSPFDGFTADYDITVSSDQHVGDDVRSSSVITDELLTAAAAGLLASTIISSGPFIGAFVTQTSVYSFGNNSDLFFQPTGEAAFPEDCLRLVSSEITATTGTVTGDITGNRLHYPTADVAGGGGTITVQYIYETLCINVATTVNPWAAAKSGQKYKYSGFNTAIITSFPLGSEVITLSKSVSPTSFLTPNTDGGFGPGIAQWTVTFTNAESVEAIVSAITDVIPGCMTIFDEFAPSSGITSANSASFPSVGSTGTQSWVGITPGDIANYQYKVPASGSISLVYQTDLSLCATDSIYTNSATGTVGTTTVGPASAAVTIGAPPLPDYGDLPDTTAGTGAGDYQTTLANGGPSHIIDSSLFIGALEPDFDADGQPNATATGDDADGGDDEDGVVITAPPGGGDNIVTQVTVSNATVNPAFLFGWVDLNADGDFGDLGEGQSSTGLDPSTSFNWIVDSITTRDYHMRFRVCFTAVECNTPAGAASDGEVEDYMVTYNPTAVTIGSVSLEAITVKDLRAGLGADQMNPGELLDLVSAWDPQAAAALSDDDDVIDALVRYLDPDGDGLVAVLRWDTLEERGTIGFYVERRNGDGQWTLINNRMLPGLVTAIMGAEYMLVDPGAVSGNVYQYQLIEQEATGTTQTYGPFELEMQ